MIFYIHGLNSSSNSEKFEKLKKFFKNEEVIGLNYDSRHLENYDKILSDLKRQIDKYKHHDQIMLVGTSLGGYWANQLSNIYKCKKVLLNPCLFPSKMMQTFVGGKQTIFETGETYMFTQEIVEALSEHENDLYKDKTLCLLEMCDEVLDNKLNQGIFKNTISYSGGNHRFSRFEEILPKVSELYYTEIFFHE